MELYYYMIVCQIIITLKLSQDASGTWNGDVWKAIVECRNSKDIDVYTCYADHGIGVILKRPNRNF